MRHTLNLKLKHNPPLPLPPEKESTNPQIPSPELQTLSPEPRLVMQHLKQASDELLAEIRHVVLAMPSLFGACRA